MCRTIAISTVAAACLTAAIYLAPGGAEKVEQYLSSGQPQAASRPGGEQARAVSVVATAATTADFPIRRHAIGSVSSPAVVNVSARIASQIVTIHVRDGQMVQAGDILFSLDDRALKAAVDRDRATLAKDQALLASAAADLARAKDLAAKEAGTKQAYDQALAAEKAVEATVAADQATLDADTVQLGFATINAPISGRLGAVSVTVGDLVAPSTGGTPAPPLVTITEIDPLRVTFNLPQTDLPLLQKALASPGSSPVTLHNDGAPQPISKGTLDFVDSSIDTASGTIAARASVPNPGLTLWPGQYVDVVVDAGVMPGMVSVPTVAVQSGQNGPFVYAIKPDRTVEVRQVEVALTEGENSAVSAGLKSGERVVVEGQTRLTEGTPIREAAASEVAPDTQDSGGRRR